MAPPPEPEPEPGHAHGGPGHAVAAAALPLTGISPPTSLDVDDGNVVENWRLWKQMWQNYSVVAKLSDQDEQYRVALCLHSLGPKALKIFNAMQFDDAKGEDKAKLDHIIKKYDEYFIGETNETYERYSFNSRDQESGETIESYVTVLRTLAQTCNFCDCIRESLIRDRMVLGVKTAHMRKRLLQERGLTLKKAIDICKSIESSSSQLKSMGDSGKADVNKVGRSSRGTKPKSYNYKDRKETAYSGNVVQCKFCGRKHERVKEKCPAWQKTCKACSGRNHFAVCCEASKSPPKLAHKTRSYHGYGRKVYNVNDDCSESETETIGCVNAVNNQAEEIHAEFLLDNKVVKFQVDCGATVNIIPEKFIGNRGLNKCSKVLRMWNRSEVKPLGQCRMTIRNVKTRKKYSVEFVVVRESFVPLLGAKAVQQMGLIKVNTKNFKVASVVVDSDPIVSKYASVFDSDIGKLPGVVHLETDSTCPPKVLPPRRVPVALKDKFYDKLQDLVDKDVLAPVDQPTAWVSQYVVATKKSGDLRICIDPGPLNKALKREHYQIPVIDDIMPELSKARVFSKLDLRNGYWHCELDEPSSLLTTFQTPKGRFRWKRLPFGTSVSSEIFQKRLSQALAGLPGVYCIHDDIFVCGFGDTDEIANKDHDQNLERLLQCCVKNNIKLNLPKTELRKPKIVFMGHQMTKEGLEIDPDKVRAILELEKPDSVESLRRFLGFVNYLARFLPRLSEVLQPLRELTVKDVKWLWTNEHDAAFAEVKRLVTSAPILAYYDPSLPLLIQCDASEKGLGCALLQNQKPVAYASRALTDTETRYAQIEKEMLAVVFSLEKFNQYTFGRHTDVHSDHKPLESITKKPLVRAPRRLQGMLLRAQKYDYEIMYKKGKEMYIADMLSRSYLPNEENCHMEFELINMVKFLPIREERLKELRVETEKDNVLQCLTKTVLTGWPELRNSLPLCLTPFFHIRDELTVQNGLLFRGERVIVPQAMQSKMMKLVHTAHLGVESCLRRARECLYWAGMTSQLREYMLSCGLCREFDACQPKETLKSHDLPDRPWQKIGTDLFEWDTKDYLVTVDYFSNFWEIDRLRSTSSPEVIRKLKAHFSRYGIPEEVVSDNGGQFDSDEFKKFSRDWDFEHHPIDPRHSQGNGKVEAAVKMAKRTLRKAKKSGTDQYLAVLETRNTPTQGLKTSPAQRLFSRRTRSLLPLTAELLKPCSVPMDTKRKMKAMQERQAKYYNRSAKDLPSLKEGDVIRLKPYKKGDKSWKKGVVQNKVGDRSYEIETESGHFRRNRVDLRRTIENPPDLSRNFMDIQDNRAETSGIEHESNSSNVPDQSIPVTPKVTTPIPAPRRSVRIRKEPERFGNSVKF